MDRDAQSLLLDLLRGGAKVVLESGAGFVSREEFAVQQRTLLDCFGLMLDSPFDLWSGGRALPYVHYRWPRETVVRDFSRVVPVLGPDDEIIGRAGPLPVASKRPFGNGLLVFVGSPLGPALRAGDAEGQAWLRLLRTV
jgi:hypothetical protein